MDVSLYKIVVFRYRQNTPHPLTNGLPSGFFIGWIDSLSSILYNYEELPYSALLAEAGTNQGHLQRVTA